MEHFSNNLLLRRSILFIERAAEYNILTPLGVTFFQYTKFCLQYFLFKTFKISNLKY